MLAHLARSAGLVSVTVPDERDEALLLRHGHRYSGKSSWTLAHERVERFNNALGSELETWRMRPVVEVLMSLRGINVVARITLVAELGDIRRFTHPREFMAFLGLVPSEHSSGSSRRLGAISKCGNGHARRVLVEAAWNYRFPARISTVLQTRREKQLKSVRDIAWRAQLRLSKRYHRSTHP
jgi:transposase